MDKGGTSLRPKCGGANSTWRILARESKSFAFSVQRDFEPSGSIHD